MRDTNCFTAIITARDGVDRADGPAPLPAVSKAPSPIMPHNDLTYHLRRAEQETRMAIGALVPRAEACHAALARLHALRLALQLLTGMAGPAGRGHRSAARPVRIEIAA
ncbi:hypothetical protein [Sphingomonas sp.]|uniref:hypothetical protein n=1 Tax=Sphingomonas sp. TaxID=28214 RepID=UPI0035AFB97C